MGMFATPVPVELPILIIGAGIGGRALARALAQAGLPAVIFDAESGFPPQDSSIHVRPDLFERLGVDATSYAREAPVSGPWALRRAWVDVYTGAHIPLTPPAGIGDAERESYPISHNELLDLLEEGIDIRFEHRLVDYDYTPQDGVVARFDNGASFQGRMIVGADGANSKVRSLFLPHLLTTVLAFVAIYGHRQLPRDVYEERIAPHMRHHSSITGVGNNLTFTIGVSGTSPEHVNLDWTYTRPATGRFNPHRALTGESIAAMRISFLKEIAALDPLAPPFAEVFKSDDIVYDVIRNWHMCAVRVPPEELAFGAVAGQAPVVLIGDAAHAMPVLTGDAGNHALLDGWELAASVAQYGELQGIHNFYKTAYPRWLQATDRAENALLEAHRPLHIWRSQNLPQSLSPPARRA